MQRLNLQSWLQLKLKLKLQLELPLRPPPSNGYITFSSCTEIKKKPFLESRHRQIQLAVDYTVAVPVEATVAVAVAVAVEVAGTA